MSNHIEIARNVLNVEIEALKQGADALGNEFSDAVEIIFQKSDQGRVVIIGMGKSGHIGKKIAATLASTGTPAIFVHPAEAGHGDLGMITRHDIVVAISQSGKSDEILKIIPYFKRNNIKIIVFSGDPTSPLANHADIFISTAIPREACPLDLAPTASTTLALALGDALAICLLQARKFSKEDFAVTHPHGSLGRKLLILVNDVMSKFEYCPIISADMKIKDALFQMSKAGMGFVIITNIDGRPIGVFTDGDLRRSLDRDVDIKKTTISKVMTKNFVAIKVNQLAVTAVNLMDQHKVSALPVVDDEGIAVGAINMRQLLQMGIV